MSKKDPQPVNPLPANATKAAIMDQEIHYGLRDGAKDAVKDTVSGLWEAATNPVETIKGTWHAVTHPIQTADLIKNTLVQSFDKEMVHGNAYTRTRWVTYALPRWQPLFSVQKALIKSAKQPKLEKQAKRQVKRTLPSKQHKPGEQNG